MNLEDRILQYLPLLAPVPTAWMVGTATFTVLHFPIPVALISALVVEGLGFVAVNTAIQMRDFNRRLSAIEQGQKMHAPVGQAYWAIVLYVAVALAMSVLLHVFPNLAVYAPIPFIMMGVSGAWMYALRADFSAKVQERNKGREQVAETKAKKKQEKADKKQQGEQVAGKQQVQVTSKGSKLQGASDKQGEQLAGKTRKLQVQARKQPVQDEALLAHWRDKPLESDRQVAEKFGTSRQAVQQRREKLVKQGAIRMTDQGVEIVGISVGYQAEVKP